MDRKKMLADLGDIADDMAYAMDLDWDRYTDRFIVDLKTYTREEGWERCHSDLYPAYKKIQAIINSLEAEADSDGDKSWGENPDRSGGQFTDDETRDTGSWI